MLHRQTGRITFFTQQPDMQADPLENRHAERYVFCQRGVLQIEGRLIRIRTRDVSLDGFEIMTEDIVPTGQRCHLRFNTIVGDGIETMQFSCTSGYCILGGLDGYRVGLTIIEQNSASRKLLNALMVRCASLCKLE